MACVPERPAPCDGGEDDGAGGGGGDDAAGGGAWDDAAEGGAWDDAEADGEREEPAGLAARRRNQRGLRQARPRRQRS